MKTITKVIIAGIIAWPVIGLAVNAGNVSSKPYSMTAKLETKFAVETLSTYTMVNSLCENHGTKYSNDAMYKQMINDLKSNFNFAESDYEDIAGYVMADHMQRLNNPSKGLANMIVSAAMHKQLKNDCPKFLADAQRYVDTTFKNYIDKQK